MRWGTLIRSRFAWAVLLSVTLVCVLVISCGSKDDSHLPGGYLLGHNLQQGIQLISLTDGTRTVLVSPKRHHYYAFADYNNRTRALYFVDLMRNKLLVLDREATSPKTLSHIPTEYGPLNDMIGGGCWLSANPSGTKVYLALSGSSFRVLECDVGSGSVRIIMGGEPIYSPCWVSENVMLVWWNQRIAEFDVSTGILKPIMQVNSVGVVSSTYVNETDHLAFFDYNDDWFRVYNVKTQKLVREKKVILPGYSRSGCLVIDEHTIVTGRAKAAMVPLGMYVVDGDSNKVTRIMRWSFLDGLKYLPKYP